MTVELSRDAAPSETWPAIRAIAPSSWPMLRSLRGDRTAMIGVVIVSCFALVAVSAPLIARHDPNAVDVVRKFAPLSARFPLGTDNLGRDVLARLIYGARVSIGSAIVAALGISSLGLALGMLAAYFGGLIDTLISRVIDVLLAFPTFLLALAITGTLGPGLRNILFAVIISWWAGPARIVRAAALAEREKAYIEAARSLGASDWRILRLHLLPNIVAPIVVLTTLDMGALLLGISGLSFLGLGIKPPTAEWGAMLAEGKNYLSQDANMMLFAGLAIFLMVLGFNLLGDGLRDALDPRLSRGRH